MDQHLVAPFVHIAHLNGTEAVSDLYVTNNGTAQLTGGRESLSHWAEFALGGER